MQTKNKFDIDKAKRNLEKRKEVLNSVSTLVSGSQAHKIAKERLLAQLVAEQEAVGRALIIKAKMGDVQAIREFFDRIYGKAKETIDFGGEVKFSLKSLAEQRAKLNAQLENSIDDEPIEIQPTIHDTSSSELKIIEAPASEF